MVETITLFPKLSDKLISLLTSLSVDDWKKPTRCPLWAVKDIAAHLLQTELGRLSSQRDRYKIENGNSVKSSNYSEIVQIINNNNGAWAKAFNAVSPQIIIELIRNADKELYTLLSGLEPQGKAEWPVSWAGETESENWFDIGREYTERWLHQQHIREATNNQQLLDYEYYHPVLQIFLMAVPYSYRETEANDGLHIDIIIEGNAGGIWHLEAINGKWILSENESIQSNEPITEIRIDQTLAWKLFSKGAHKDETDKGIRIKGNKSLAENMMKMVSVMA